MPEFDRRRPSGTTVKSNKPKRRKKKQNVIVAILSGLLPWKGDSMGNVVRKMVFLVSLIVIIYAAFALIDFYFIRDIRMKAEIEAWEKLKDDYMGEDRITINLGDIRPTDSAEDSEKEVEIIGEYLEYYNQNEDFVGYVSIYPIIQYPVLQSDDNDYYLNHNFDKVPTTNGTIFTDFEGVFTPTERPHNTIIYGHNLLTKYFFQPLKYFRDDMEFLEQHPTIEFDTLYERGTYKIFSVFLLNANENYGEVFPYWQTVYFESKTEFDNYVAEALDRSYYYTGVDLEYGDELLTLSTCDFSVFMEDMRLVIMARRVRENENPKVDTTKFIDNRGNNSDKQVKRKMFDAYYQTFSPNGWAGRSWDLSYIKDFEG